MQDQNSRWYINPKLGLGFLALFCALIGCYLAASIMSVFQPLNGPVISMPFSHTTGNTTAIPGIDGIKRFASEDEFKGFLDASRPYDQTAVSTQFGARTIGSGTAAGLAETNGSFRSTPSAPPSATPTLKQDTVAGTPGSDNGSLERVSGTNVQIIGIDEPDIAKTDGRKLYFSPETSYYLPMAAKSTQGKIAVPAKPVGQTKIINAVPAENLGEDSSINERGSLLLAGNVLLIISDNEIFGYDISNSKEPQRLWQVRIEDGSEIEATRLFNGTVYLVVRATVNYNHPCPIRPLTAGSDALVIRCEDIYHPESASDIDSTFHAFTIDPETGKFGKSISFVGSSSDTVVSMSANALYVTWKMSGDYAKFYADFLEQKCKDVIPAYLSDKIGKLSSYEISNTAKITEMQILLANYSQSITPDERVRVSNELTNRMADYAREHSRDLDGTGIAKISTEAFTITATGMIPGSLINQFALDEYNGNLRAAVTVGGNNRWNMFWDPAQTANDVYVLDENLEQIGAVQGLGLDERIYSVRFVNEKGYLVTFRQTDPFYILDLSDAKHPEMKGELKIPGYSAYLHPVDGNTMLGVGKDSWKVKLSLFDVTLAAQPRETAKYQLDEYWTEVEGNHHAFLLDAKHKLFFIPGSKGGYIFSYETGAIELKKALTGFEAKRAVFINDNLYVIGDSRITVIDEKTFKQVKQLDLDI